MSDCVEETETIHLGVRQNQTCFPNFVKRNVINTYTDKYTELVAYI